MSVQDKYNNTEVDYHEEMRNKIIGCLSIYPRISPSMLQIGIGSSIPPKIWRPVLGQLIEEGIVESDTLVALSASGRNQTYTILSLSASINK